MKTTIDAMKQAMNALKYHTEQTRPIHQTDEAIEALREVIDHEEALQASGSAAVSAKPPWTTCPDCGYDIARASAKPLPLTISGHQLSEALEFLAPDGTDEQLGQEVCIQHGLEGLYCWLEDCPEEGSIVLIGEPLPASAAADNIKEQQS